MTLNCLILLAVSLPLALRWSWLARHTRILPLPFGWLCVDGGTLTCPCSGRPLQQLPIGGARCPALTPRGNRTLASSMVVLAVGGFFTAGFTLQGHLAPSQVERFDMEGVAPLQELPVPTRWLSEERMTFDRQLNALLTYNHSRDERLLERYRRDAARFFPRDARFSPSPSGDRESS